MSGIKQNQEIAPDSRFFSHDGSKIGCFSLMEETFFHLRLLGVSDGSEGTGVVV